MLTSVSRRMAADFFGNVAATVRSVPSPEAAPPRLFGQPALTQQDADVLPKAVRSTRSQWARRLSRRGIAVGAGHKCCSAWSPADFSGRR